MEHSVTGEQVHVALFIETKTVMAEGTRKFLFTF